MTTTAYRIDSEEHVHKRIIDFEPKEREATLTLHQNDVAFVPAAACAIWVLSGRVWLCAGEHTRLLQAGDVLPLNPHRREVSLYALSHQPGVLRIYAGRFVGTNGHA